MIPKIPPCPEVLPPTPPVSAGSVSQGSRRAGGSTESYHGEAETKPLRVHGTQAQLWVCGYAPWGDHTDLSLPL